MMLRFKMLSYDDIKRRRLDAIRRHNSRMRMRPVVAPGVSPDAWRRSMGLAKLTPEEIAERRHDAIARARVAEAVAMDIAKAAEMDAKAKKISARAKLRAERAERRHARLDREQERIDRETTARLYPPGDGEVRYMGGEKEFYHRGTWRKW